ncbi:hypothetical protein KZP23_02040 [Echinicola marina]|uniref:hypothetical protein n=1 Tax=Echinicola marina TaxID=2859768 RepID=UPI001CF65613|nr:hypothetical protein [Echinicola marina]UCS93840.1 hypothetical protein KZP23_02040 [Echinicola marina]
MHNFNKEIELKRYIFGELFLHYDACPGVERIWIYRFGFDIFQKEGVLRSWYPKLCIARLIFLPLIIFSLLIAAFGLVFYALTQLDIPAWSYLFVFLGVFICPVAFLMVLMFGKSAKNLVETISFFKYIKAGNNLKRFLILDLYDMEEFEEFYGDFLSPVHRTDFKWDKANENTLRQKLVYLYLLTYEFNNLHGFVQYVADHSKNKWGTEKVYRVLQEVLGANKDNIRKAQGKIHQHLDDFGEGVFNKDGEKTRECLEIAKTFFSCTDKNYANGVNMPLLIEKIDGILEKYRIDL